MQNDYHLAKKWGADGKKWAGVEASSKKLGQCVENARVDSWSQSALVLSNHQHHFLPHLTHQLAYRCRI